MTKDPVSDSDSAARVLHAYHALATLSLSRKKLEAAANNCRQALIGRQRTKTIGRSHPEYIASLRLFALITWAKGDKIRAEAYSDMLPKEEKIEGDKFDMILKTEFGISGDFSSKSKPTSPSQESQRDIP